jgi:hypothetical protein
MTDEAKLREEITKEVTTTGEITISKMKGE